VCFCRKLGFHNSAAAHPELPVARHRSGVGAAFAGAHHGWTGDGRSALCSSRGCSSVSQKEDAVQLRHLEKQEIRHLGLHHPPDPPWLFRPLRPHGEKISSCKKICAPILIIKKQGCVRLREVPGAGWLYFGHVHGTHLRSWTNYFRQIGRFA
jgi:hypothetical protein